MGAAAEPPHQAPGHSPTQLELRGRQSALVHAPPLRGWVHTLQVEAWSPRQGPKMGLTIKRSVYFCVNSIKLNHNLKET